MAGCAVWSRPSRSAGRFATPPPEPAGEGGADVVEPHTEDPELAHEELYLVAAGTATFTIDGETFDAPQGTYVFIPDPASHRHAVAKEAGTTVLSFGGLPRIGYEIACLEAVSGNREAALNELRAAVDAEPELAGWAREDEVFDRLREDSDFKAIVDR